MHKINVLAFGFENFTTSLNELKDFLNFKLTCNSKKPEKDLLKDIQVILIHEDFLTGEILKENFIKNCNKIKILFSNSKKIYPNLFQERISLPASVRNINEIVENSLAKKNFTMNSFIEIKGYILDKNEKKLKKDKLFILLTEKEIKLLELLLNNKNSTHKDQILNQVWKYSNDADTHTVETHIYRLRKKIRNKFSDENFILNDKAGYSI